MVTVKFLLRILTSDSMSLMKLLRDIFGRQLCIHLYNYNFYKEHPFNSVTNQAEFGGRVLERLAWSLRLGLRTYSILIKHGHKSVQIWNLKTNSSLHRTALGQYSSWFEKTPSQVTQLTKTLLFTNYTITSISTNLDAYSSTYL